MKKVKTSELSGAQLDWAVTQIEHPEYSECVTVEYSSEWDYGGPIIEREGIQIQKHRSGWVALPEDAQFSEEEYQEGPTILIAAMRCYVASKLGEEVDMVSNIEAHEIGDKK